MLRVAGQVADGVRLHPLCSRRYLEEVCLPNLLEGMRRSGRSRSHFDVHGGGFVVTGPDEATVAAGMQHARRRIGFYGSTRTYMPILALHGLQDLGLKLHRMSVEGRWESMAEEVPDDVVRIFAACGTFEQIAGAIEQRFGGVADFDRPAFPARHTGRTATRSADRHQAASRTASRASTRTGRSNAMAVPTFRFDPVELPPEAIALRHEVRAFIKEHQHLMGFTRGEFNRDFSRAMGKRGWIGMTWPKQYGGHERSSFERYVVIEEMLVAGAPLSAHYTGDRQSGPNLLRFGTEEQKQFFLPKIAAGELTFCIGMSEPNSGSDLAGTRTRAVKVDGGYKINGSKLWTSNAHRADYAILFCKMAQEGQAEPGPSRRRNTISARPEVARHRHPSGASICSASITSTKSSSPTSSFPTGCCWARKATAGTRSPASCRSNAARQTASWCSSRCCARCCAWPGPHPDRATAAALGRLVAQLATLRSMSLSIAGMLQEGMQPNSESAVVKDLGTRYEQDIPVVARQLFPTEPELEAVDVYTSMIARATMNAPRLSIQGGTREILRGIIARGLGLR